MSESGGGRHYKPYVPEETNLPEFTFRALILGVILAAVLGAANAFVGMKAGLTVAATFPAAVIALAVHRLWKGSILEENLTRTTASVGEALVAGAIFTVPAFVLVGYWTDLLDPANYLEGSLLLLVGGVLGVLFVIVLRRALVSESDLPFPEAVAAASIHKVGQKGATGASLVFGGIGVSMLLEFLKSHYGIPVIRERIEGFLEFGKSAIELGKDKYPFLGGLSWRTPNASPMLMGVGYIIGPRLAAINFSGGLLAWGFLVPAFLFIGGTDGPAVQVAHETVLANHGSAALMEVAEANGYGLLEDDTPEKAAFDNKLAEWRGIVDASAVEVSTKYRARADVFDSAILAEYDAAVLAQAAGLSAGALETLPAGEWQASASTDGVALLEDDARDAAYTGAWQNAAGEIWFKIVRPIAVGAMLVGAFFTLYNMRKQLFAGITKALGDLRAMKAGTGKPSRYEHDLPVTIIGILIGVMVIPTFFVYWHFTGNIGAAAVLAVVMVAAGFLFCAVAGYLVGLIGSSSNPISGLTLSTLIVAAGLMVLISQTGTGGVAAVLGVAAVVCCACGIGGDMMQDLKVGHILGGTPAKMQIGEMIAVVIVSFLLIAPIGALHAADIQQGGIGIGGEQLPAPQAGLMAMLSKGIIGGEMAWPLVIVGAVFALGMILIKAPSPMLIAVGMYLPLHSTFAIFVGGLFRWAVDAILRKRGASDSEVEESGDRGVLVASGLIAGEALTGVLLAFYVIITKSKDPIWNPLAGSAVIPTILMCAVFVLVGFMMISPALKHYRESKKSA